MPAPNPPFLHWNYFIALESDIEKLSRYVEFSELNYSTYSLEMAHLLLATASEVEVVLKGICKKIKPNRKPNKFYKYRRIVKPVHQNLCNMKVLIPRYGLEITPWEKWQNDETPNWWTGYNNVKHNRGKKYREANLHNSLAAITGLFAVLLFLYEDEAKGGNLGPNPRLLGPDESYDGGFTSSDFGFTNVYDV